MNKIGGGSPTPHIAPALKLILSAEHTSNAFGVRNMLLLQNPSRENLRRIVIENRYRPLQNDDAMVHSLVDKVHGAAGDLHAVIKRLVLSIKPRKGRQQRRMNVDDPVRKRLHESRSDNSHVTGKANKVD